jgi:hypothetical protein
MPALLQELDIEPQFDGSPSFNDGVVSNERANLISPASVSIFQNVDLTRFGRATTRRGTSLLGSGVAGTGTNVQGVINYKTHTNNYLVAVNNAKLYSWQDPNWVQLGTYAGSDTGVMFSLAQGVDKLFWADGVANLQMWDGAAVTDLGGVTNTDPPNNPRYLLWFTNRLLAAGMPDQPDAVYFSEPLDGTVWNRTWWELEVGGGDGKPITALAPWLDFNVVVGKRDSMWLINANPALIPVSDVNQSVSYFEVRPIHEEVGTIAPFSFAQVGSDVMFLATDGIRAVQRTVAAEAQSQVSEPLSYPIQDIIDRINPAYAYKSAATYFKGKYMLAVPLDDATAPNYVIVYNAILQRWGGYWTGWLPTGFANRTPDAGASRLCIGQSDGTVLEWLDYVQVSSEVNSTFQDNGVDIPTQVRTRAFTLAQDPLSQKELLIAPKTGFKSWFEFDSSLADATIGYLIDGQTTVTNFDESPIDTSASGGVTLPLTLPVTFPTAGIKNVPIDIMRCGQWRELQFDISSVSGKLSLRKIDLTAFLDSFLSNL